MLEVRDLVVTVRGRELFTVQQETLGPGASLGIVGPSGSGKTTLLRALVGLGDTRAFDRAVRLHGQSPLQFGLSRYRRAVVLVSQRPSLLEGPVRQSLMRPFEYAIGGEPYPEALAVTLLGRLGLGQSLVERDARSLSLGEQQRVALVRSLLLRPSVLLLDEPTSALDPEARLQAERVFREHLEAGGALLLVSHDSEQLARLTSRVRHVPDAPAEPMGEAP